jgi:hypothetical protein
MVVMVMILMMIILSREEAIHLAYGMSVVLLRCPFVPDIMHGRAHEVFLHQ